MVQPRRIVFLLSESDAKQLEATVELAKAPSMGEFLRAQLRPVLGSGESLIGMLHRLSIEGLDDQAAFLERWALTIEKEMEARGPDFALRPWMEEQLREVRARLAETRTRRASLSSDVKP